MDKKQLALKIHQLLVDAFGDPDWRPHLDPVGELVSTILSQNTNDVNRDAAFDNLTAKYHSWEAVRDAPPEDLLETIRIAGLANQKGPAIQNALKVISEERGKIELDFLASLSVEEAESWLTQLKGVGPKTAAIVLLFSLDMPAFPVDTHIYRVTGRLGIRPVGMSANKAHHYLASLFPPETYYPVHLNLIKLGREICKAHQPLCKGCPLQSLCDFYETHND